MENLRQKQESNALQAEKNKADKAFADRLKDPKEKIKYLKGMLKRMQSLYGTEDEYYPHDEIDNIRQEIAALAATKTGLEPRGPIRWTLVTGPALEKFLRVFAAQFSSMEEDLEVYAAKVGRKTVFAHDSGVIRLYVAGDDGFAYSQKVYGGIKSVDLENLKPILSAAAMGLSPETANEGVYKNGPLNS